MKSNPKVFSVGGFRPPGLFTERKAQAGFAFALVCLGVIGLLSYLSVNRLREDAEWTSHTEEVIASLRLLLSQVTGAETSQRGYLITGEESYLEPYQEAQRSIAAQFQSLRKLTADNAAQQRRLDAMEPLIAQRMARLGAMVALQRSSGFAAVQAAIATGVGKRLQDQIRGLAAEMETAEQMLLPPRQVRTERSGRRALAIILGGSVLALGVVAGALFAAWQDAAHRRAQAAQAALAGRLSRLGAWSVELPGLKQTWSDEVYAIHEMPPGATPNVEDSINHYAPEFRATITGAFEACMREGTPYDVETQIITARGRRVWVRSIGEAARDASGSIRRVQGAIQDISDRKQTEESLRTSQANMAAAQRIAHFGSWELALPDASDLAANPLHWSDEMFRIVGYEPGTIEASSELFFRLVPAEEHAAIRQAVAAAIREHQRYTIVHRFIRPNGEERIVQETAQILLEDKTGRPRKIVGTAHDITERTRSEIALRESEERFAAAFEQAPIGVALVSPEGRWLKVNRALCHLVGYTEAELLARTFQDITHPADLTADLGNMRRLLAGEIPTYQMEKRYVHARGHLVTILLDVTLVRDGQGRPRYFISQIQDISGRKRAEAELEQAHRELVKSSRMAGMAELATGILHNVGNVLNSINVASTCLADSLKRSKAANLAKVVALLQEHEADLGTFLTQDPKGRLVPGYLAQLAENLVAEQAGALQELAALQKNIEHIKEVVTVQQGGAKQVGRAETLRMTELVEATLRMDAGGPAFPDIQIIRDFQSTPDITVDRHKILQILMNLVRNAKQACQETGRADQRLTVRVTSGDDRVRVAVSDNGVGISPQNLGRIFTHGFTTKKDGHGFGLQSAAAAAKEMGGTLTVHSDGEGRGATFVLELPAKPDPLALGSSGL